MHSQRRFISLTLRFSRCLHRLQHQQKLMESTSAACASPPVSDGQEKIYSEKIHNIVNDISKLNLLEVADLNALLKKTLNIRDAPVMAAAALPVAAAESKDEEDEDALPVKKEKMSFTVKMTSFDASKKVAIIKAVKGIIPNMNLVQAKKFIESLPQIVKADLPKDEAEALKKELEDIGAGAELD